MPPKGSDLIFDGRHNADESAFGRHIAEFADRSQAVLWGCELLLDKGEPAALRAS
jgi:hypothetical protein